MIPFKHPHLCFAIANSSFLGFLFLSSKQLFAHLCILKSTMEIIPPSPLLTYNRCKRGWVYYRQWIVITQLTIRFSSVHVAHTCGLLALLLIGVWEILMKNKAGMTRRDSTAHTGYFTHRKKVKFKIRWFGENALWWGSMPGCLCKGNQGPAPCCLANKAFFSVGQVDLDQLSAVADFSSLLSEPARVSWAGIQLLKYKENNP